VGTKKNIAFFIWLALLQPLACFAHFSHALKNREAVNSLYKYVARTLIKLKATSTFGRLEMQCLGLAGTTSKCQLTGDVH